MFKIIILNNSTSKVIFRVYKDNLEEVKELVNNLMFNAALKEVTLAVYKNKKLFNYYVF